MSPRKKTIEQENLGVVPTSKLLELVVLGIVRERKHALVQSALEELDRRIPPPTFNMGAWLYGAQIAQDKAYKP